MTTTAATAAPAAAPPGGPDVRRRFSWLAAGVWVHVAVVVQLLRSSHTPVWDSIWSEDGRFFYTEARAEPGWTLLLKPAVGYVQVVPRFLAWGAAQVATEHAAIALSVLAASTVALLSVYVFVASETVVEHRWQRCTLAALVVLHPAAAYEVNATINNLHWYLMFAAVWACLSSATSTRRIGLDVVVVLLAALSDPLTGLLLPLVLLRCRGRRKGPRWVALALATGLLVQALSVSHASVLRHPRHPADLPLVYGLRVTGSLLVGDRAAARLWDDVGRLFAILALIAVATGAVFVVGRLYERERGLVLVVIAYSVVFFAAPILLRGGEQSYLQHPTTAGPSRYLVIPLWLLYTALIVAAGSRRWHSASLRRSVPVAVVPVLVVLLLGVQLATNFAPASGRTGVSWRSSVSRARVVCQEGVAPRPSTRPRDETQPVVIAPDQIALPVAPYWALFYSVRLRCEQLGR
jgi:hypothetical protein